MAIALVCGSIGAVFIVALPRIFKVTFLDYSSHTMGMILMGFSIVYLLPKIERTF